ncbi:LacI family DNA-binding transcriptional regulator [Paenibacillus xylaniclasticus]|uniref:LacI family DNA-binding transcriptional regulator n=1 Tax=Paenibacillus xylaniclasticus TaxID=588083 RepID=UPI000FDBDDBA|nr:MULTISPECIES: LacI family DNA-binding transcriptional regulator [Paenibacillus]GFN33370.1 LacI family transcriptional regulator [Paenibacillus curdlanolyticus]
MAQNKKVSMQDIANRLNISKNAVSLALQNKPGVGDELRHKIVETAKALGYGPYGQKHNSGGAVLVLVPERIMSYEDNDHFQFFHDMIWGLEKSVRAKGWNAVITPIDAEMEAGLVLPRHCTEMTYKGIILFGIVERAYAKRVWELDVPLVMLDSYHRGLPCPVVATDNIEGAYEAVEFLIRSGHRNIGFIGPTNLTSSHEERWFGYWKAMTDNGLSIDPAQTTVKSVSFHHSAEEIRSLLDRLGHWPTAFFCSNDRIAYLLADELEKRGMRVPDDISIVGFDDLKAGAGHKLSLTTMRVEKLRMCDAAAELLLSLPGKSREMVRYYIRPTLVVRGSVR